jgi:hypothetical protein
MHCEQEVDGSIPFVRWSSFADGHRGSSPQAVQLKIEFYFHMHNGLMGHRPLEKLWLANTESAEVIVQLKIELVGGPDGKGRDCNSQARK